MSSQPIATIVPELSVPKRVVGQGWRIVRHGNRAALLGSLALLLILLAGFVAPLPHDPKAFSLASLHAPSSTYWFGTDTLGRDIFSRVVRASSLDLPLALLGTLASLVVGVAVGLLVSGKNRASEWVMRGLDVFMAFPLLVLAIALVTLAGNHTYMVIVVIAIIFFPRFTRLVRVEALAIRESRYVEAAIATGASPYRVMAYHILPSVSGIILVQATLTASQALLAVAGLSFLGVGVSQQSISWGLMMSQGRDALTTGQWWLSIFPGLAVFICVVLFNLVADGLEVVFGRGARG